MKKFLAALIALGAAAGAQAQSPHAVMQGAVKAYADMRSVRAEFRQTINNPLTGTNVTSRGVLLRKDPNFVSITFSDPKGDRVVSDGETLWIYLPSSAPGQALRTSAQANNALALMDPAGAFLTSPSTRFEITGAGTATVQGRKTNVVNLVPKSPNGAFTRAKLWIDASSSLIRQFEVTDINGLKRTIEITSVSLNPALAASEFRFVPPKNVRVLGSQQN